MTKSSLPQNGFISTAFLLVFCLMMSLIALRSDYIIKADQVYYDLECCEEMFAHEALVIERAKCLLLQEGELDDFPAGDVYVNVSLNDEGYDLYYECYRIHLYVNERQIINFYVQKVY